MRLLDSNILIYASQPENSFLRAWVLAPDARVSAISIPEVLGFAELDPMAEAEFEEWFEALSLFEVSRAVLRRSAALRRQQRLKLGDAIIAATALENGCELVTRNVRDFSGIPGLTVINPFDLPGESEKDP
jgi:toxin FitB